MKIMIVGGAGYIGSMLTRELVQAKHEVSVIDLMWFGERHVAGAAKVWKGDARELIIHDLLGIDVVIFLAGLSNDPMADFDPLLNFELNTSLPVYLAHIAKQAGVKKFIHGGSCSVYGHSKMLMHENSVPLTSSAYGVSKLLGELGCRQYEGAMQVVCFRMGTVCGWSPRMRFDLVINAMVKNAITIGKITVNDPDAQRPILDIRDAVAGYRFAVEKLHVSGIFNLFSQNATVRDIATKTAFEVKRFLNKTVYIENIDRADIRSYIAAREKLERMGFSATHSIDNTIQNVVEDYDWSRFEERDDFYNIKVFQKMEAERSSKLTAVVAAR